MKDAAPSCPVCRARFRGSSQCSRCGADLTAPMLLAARAYALRQAARQSLLRGDGPSALTSAQTAQRLHFTAQGRLLSFVCTATASLPT
jgi:hypothetical protein